MESKTYENQEAWKQIQGFLPERLAFTQEHHPVEEWWEHNGHVLHLDRWRNPDAKIVLSYTTASAGFDLVAIDMPGYGCTQVASHGPQHLYSYNDWVQIANDFINFELDNDPRPIVLYGLSAGGMLTYHAAALNKRVKGIVGMTFLDQRSTQVRDETSRNLFMSRVGVPLAKLSDNLGMGSVSMPMSVASKMYTLVNDKKALKVFMSDKTSAASWATMRFLNTYANYKPALEPEDFDVCPILLTQPAEDRWTPLHLSEPFLSRVKKVPVKISHLQNAGHYPLEDPGLQQMVDAIISFLNDLSAQSS